MCVRAGGLAQGSGRRDSKSSAQAHKQFFEQQSCAPFLIGLNDITVIKKDRGMLMREMKKGYAALALLMVLACALCPGCAGKGTAEVSAAPVHTSGTPDAEGVSPGEAPGQGYASETPAGDVSSGPAQGETAPRWDPYYRAPFAAGSGEEAAALVAGAFLAEAAGEAGIEAAEETALVLQETWTDLTEGQVHVYRLSYRLRPVDMESNPLAGGVGVEDGWLYPQDELLFLWENKGDYQLAGLAAQESCQNVFDAMSGTWRLAAMRALSSHPDLSLKEEAEYDAVLSALLESEGDFLPEGASDGRAYGFFMGRR